MVTDIDGTLLDPRGQVTPRTRAAIQELRRRGAALVLSTARPPRTLHGLYRDLDLQGPVIAYNGALIYEPDRPKLWLHRAIPKAVALAVVAAIRAIQPDLNLGLEMEDEWHVDRIDERMRGRLDAGLLTTPPIAGRIPAVISESRREVSKLYFVAPPPVRAAVEQHLAAAGLDRHISFTSSGAHFVEIMAAGANKGSALEAVARTLGIPVQETVFLGDEETDKPALQRAGLGIAMGNAPAHVQAAARVVTGANSADGWAEAIERYVLAG